MSEAIVIFSGGQDSTTCLALAKSRHKEVHAITFNYGQRHVTELQAAIAIAQKMGVTHEIIDIGGGVLTGSSPLISNSKLGKYESVDDLPGGVEPTFVYGRNILFLTIAANRAACMEARFLYTGVCQADFAGYWDCRQSFIDKMQVALNEGIYGEDRLSICTPLMNLTKAESVKLSVDLLGDDFEPIFELTHTCYDGIKGGCGKCHACILRDKGFNESGQVDPLWKFRK